MSYLNDAVKRADVEGVYRVLAEFCSDELKVDEDLCELILTVRETVPFADECLFAQKGYPRMPPSLFHVVARRALPVRDTLCLLYMLNPEAPITVGEIADVKEWACDTLLE